MSTYFRLLLLLLAACANGGAYRGGDDPGPAAWRGSLKRADGQRLPGKLVVSGPSAFQFLADGSDMPIPLDTGAVVAFAGAGPDPTAASPPFRLELGLGRRISGRLSKVYDGGVRLENGSSSGPPVEARGGVWAIVQRQGEMQVLDDGFETLDTTRWRVMGDARLADDPRIAGEHSLRIPAEESSVTCRMTEPVTAGRLELAFHDGGELAAGQQCFVDLLFRGAGGQETVRAILGWSEESHSVESPGGPALAVQRLARKAGWHRLTIRFGPRQTEIGIDGNDLAHGKGPGGPLIEIRLASHVVRKAEGQPPVAVHLDDLRLVRFSDASGGLELDPTQDEVRLAGGDQVFGKVVEADAQHLSLKVDGKPIDLPWSDVSGIHFRRVALQANPVEGLLVRVDWRNSPDDPLDFDRLDGTVVGVTGESMILDAPYLGKLTIPRTSVQRLEVLGRCRRIVIDATAHHLGNQIVGSPLPLDPPQPEGRSLERVLELPSVPAGDAQLTFDVAQVAGEASGLPFADEVKKGQFRTNVKLNGKQIDYLNRHITSNNDTPERIRIPIPPGLLHAGQNIIRLELVGTPTDPDNVDDLGVYEMAVEFSRDAPARVAPDSP